MSVSVGVVTALGIGGSSQRSATAFPHNTQVCDIAFDRALKVSLLQWITSCSEKRGTDTDSEYDLNLSPKR